MGLDGAVTATTGWTVIVPIKGLGSAKSRLQLPQAPDLMYAFAFDTLAAVTAVGDVGEVIVATSDSRIIDLAHSSSFRVVDDRGQTGINGAASFAATQRRGSGGLVVMVADLPALTPEAMAFALHLAAAHPTAILADADGDGTTMFFASEAAEARPRFGPASRAVHVSHGAVDLVDSYPQHYDDLWPARCDVDTAADLDRAIGLGVGSATRAVVAALAI
jgi:2-phospho-L-lactate guanylyltransferase